MTSFVSVRDHAGTLDSARGRRMVDFRSSTSYGPLPPPVHSGQHLLMKIFADLSTKYDYFYVSQGSCSYLGFPETRPVGGFLIVDVLRPLPPRCIVAIFFDEHFCSPVH